MIGQVKIFIIPDATFGARGIQTDWDNKILRLGLEKSLKQSLMLYFQMYPAIETRSVEVGGKGVYFAFRDQGTCLALLTVKVKTSFVHQR